MESTPSTSQAGGARAEPVAHARGAQVGPHTGLHAGLQTGQHTGLHHGVKGAGPSPAPMLQALSLLPSGLFVFSGQYEGRRSGTLVRWVTLVSTEPALVCVSMRKGHWVSPIVRDSHHFGISMVKETERLVLKKFTEMVRPKDGDPFDCLALEKLSTGVPLLAKSPLVLDCEVTRHLDLEADFEMFIGRVLGYRMTPGAGGDGVAPQA